MDDSVLHVLLSQTCPPGFWFEKDTLNSLQQYREDPIQWGEIRAVAKRQGIDPWDLDKAVATTTTQVDALLDSIRFPFVSTTPYVAPLPPRASIPYVPEPYSWLEQYAAHSAYWAPRAAPSYHKAVGLWVLSTIAARRVVVHMGSTPVYPTLFLALVSESTHWTKTTAAAIGLRMIKRANCGHLLAPDRTTPQFLLKLMAGIVPQEYGTKNAEEQAAMCTALGFAAQRGWFYEEWGGMLHQMRRMDSPHAELNKLLIVLEGGAETFETGTIQRGLERIESPYLALLGNATPHDLAPFMMEGTAWWHDGFWPRFVCVTPPQGVTPSRIPRPREAYQLPANLVLPLHEWHTRLGSPSVEILEEREANGKATGRWVGTIGALPCETLTLDEAVYDAYETYNDALLEVVHQGNVHEDLSPWYGRAHEKALRVAMLLASMDGASSMITMPYWAEGQAMVEGWRTNLHQLVTMVAEKTPLSREGQRESRIESLCAQTGGLTAREIQRHLKGSTSEEVSKLLKSMVQIGSIRVVKSNKKILYTIFHEEAGDD